jgi:hypothetical protein
VRARCAGRALLRRWRCPPGRPRAMAMPATAARRGLRPSLGRTSSIARRKPSPGTRLVGNHAQGLQLVLRYVFAHPGELAPPGDDSRVGELVPEAPNSLASSSSGDQPRGNAGERSQKRLEARALLGANQQVQVITRVGIVVDANRGAARQCFHRFPQASLHAPQRPRSPSSRGAEHDVERAARREGTRELAPAAPHRAPVLDPGSGSEVRTREQR